MSTDPKTSVVDVLSLILASQDETQRLLALMTQLLDDIKKGKKD